MTISAVLGPSRYLDHQTVIHAIRNLYPILVLSYYGIITAFSACALHSVSPKFRDEKARRKLIIILELLFLSTYVAEIISFASRAIVDHQWPCSSNHLVYLLFSTLVWSIEIFDLVNSSFPVWYPHIGSWALGVAAETALLVLYGVYRLPDDSLTWATSIVRLCRICLLLSLPTILFLLPKSQLDSIGDEESQPLLDRENSNMDANNEPTDTAAGASVYGAMSQAQVLATSARRYLSREIGQPPIRRLCEIVQQHQSWWQYAKRFLVFLPYIWPFHSRRLQLKLFLVVIFSLIVCAIEVLLPRQLGLVVDALVNNSESMPWLQIIIFLVLQLSISRFGIPYLLKLFWDAYDKFLLQALAMTAFVNLIQQSNGLRDRAKLVELPFTVEYGQAVRNLLRTIFSATIPRLAGLVASFVFLHYLFGVYLVMIAVLAAFLLLVGSVKLDDWKDQAKLLLSAAKQEHVRSARDITGICRTIFGGQRNASDRKDYEDVVSSHVQALGKYYQVDRAAGAFKAFILTLALLAAFILGSFQVAKGDKPIGNLVAMVAYWPQFSACLTLLANWCGLEINDILEAEKYLVILERIPNVEGTAQLGLETPCEGSRGGPFFDQSGSSSARFAINTQEDHHPSNGSVSNTSLPIIPGLDNFSFEVDAGKKIAIVGNESSTFSTVFSLLVGSAATLANNISIGGVSLQNTNINQVRDEIVMVSQDPLLLNDTVLESLRDARPGASHLDVYIACNAAGISYFGMLFTGQHDSALPGSTRDGTPTSRYLVSVAQAFLRDSKIVVLEPLNECKDVMAQKHVVETLERLTKNRLAFVQGQDKETLTEVDGILYFEKGSLVEAGDHMRLMSLKGKYYDFFNDKFAATSVQDEGSHDRKSGILKRLCFISLEASYKHLKGADSHQRVTPYSTGGGSKSAQDNLDDSTEQNLGKAREPSKDGIKSASERNSANSLTEPFPPLPASREGSDQSVGNKLQGSTNSASHGSIWKPDVPEFIPTSQQPAGNDPRGESQQHQLDPGSATARPRREKESWAQRREREKHDKELKKREDTEKKAENKNLKKAKKEDKATSKRKFKGNSRLAATESESSAQVASLESHSMASMDGAVDGPKPFFEKRRRTRSRHLKPKHDAGSNANLSPAKSSLEDHQSIPHQPELGQAAAPARKVSQEELQDERAVYRTPVYRRRAQSKSDPIGGGHFDGSDESVKPSSKDYRRVSTPFTGQAITQEPSPSQERKHRQSLNQGQASSPGFSDSGSRSSPINPNVAPRAQSLTSVEAVAKTDSGLREVRFEDQVQG